MEVYYTGRNIHERFKDVGRFLPKECYDNTFMNLNRFDDIYIEIVFCWVQVMPGSNLYARHACYLVEGEILDLTLYHLREGYEGLEGIKYYPFKILTVDEYLDAMQEGAIRNDTTGLFRVLKKEEEESRQWVTEQGNICI